MKRDILFLGRRQGDFSQEIGQGNYVLNAEFAGRSGWFLPWFCPRPYLTLSGKARSRSKNQHFLTLHVRHCALQPTIPLVNYTTPGFETLGHNCEILRLLFVPCHDYFAFFHDGWVWHHFGISTSTEPSHGCLTFCSSASLGKFVSDEATYFLCGGKAQHNEKPCQRETA